MKNLYLCIAFIFLEGILVSGQDVYHEHIILDTDRDIYIAGENIWFHAQCEDPLNNADSLLSRILYLELYDQKYNTINKIKVRIIQGHSTGHIPIPVEIHTGNYFLRAYTQYSRNSSSDMICTSLLCIVNPSKPLPSYETTDDEFILAVPAQGKFMPGRNSIALRMAPLLARNTAAVLLSDETGNRLSSEKPYENGLCMLEFNLQSIPVSLFITIKQYNGKEIRKELSTHDVEVSKTIPDIIQNLPDNHESLLPGDIKITSNKKEYTKRESVMVSYSNSKMNQPPFIFVSAHDGHFEKKNLIPWYLAYNPALLPNYLDHLYTISDSMKKQLEILRILYSLHDKNAGNSGNKSLWLPETRDAGISGVIINKQTGKPIKDIVIYASAADEKNQVHLYKTGEDGRFFFTLNHLTGLHNVYITPGPSDSLNLEILINSDFESSYPESSGIIPFMLDTTDIDLLNRLSRNAALCSIYPKYTPEVNKINYFDALPIVRQENVIKISDYIEMPVMTEIFSEIVPFVTVKKKDNHYYFQVFDNRTGATYDNPLVLFDGIPVFDIDQLMEIPPEQIESVEVTNKILFLGDFKINGMISIHSNTRDFSGMKLPQTSRFIEFNGITEESSPVFPVHQNGESDRNPDFRTLLFWGEMKPGQDNITFSTSDQTGDYSVTVIAGPKRAMLDFLVTSNPIH